jgi:hypothetical protein
MRRLFITILLGSLLSCGRTTDSGLTASDKVDTLVDADNVALDSIDFNILKYDTSYRHIFSKTAKTPQLSEKEIIECELLLKLFIAGYNAEAIKKFDEMTKKYPGQKFNEENFTIELKDYGRQYMAVLDNGIKLVYVNCFCDPKVFDYRDKRLVHVFDGGNCFFNLKINLTEKKIFGFVENGQA